MRTSFRHWKALAVLAALGALVVASLASGAPVKSRTVTISAGRASWTSTGVRLAKGQSVTLTVRGNAKCGAGTDCPAGDPLGARHTCVTRTLGPLKPGVAGPTVNYGSVAAKVGTYGKPQMVGRRHVVHGPGLLFVVYNDCAGYYADNTGSFTITIG